HLDSAGVPEMRVALDQLIERLADERGNGELRPRRIELRLLHRPHVEVPVIDRGSPAHGAESCRGQGVMRAGDRFLDGRWLGQALVTVLRLSGVWLDTDI